MNLCLGLESRYAMSEVYKICKGKVVSVLEFNTDDEALSFMYQNNGVVKAWGIKYVSKQDYERNKGRIRQAPSLKHRDY